MAHSYLFEAASIQSYIFDSTKLKDIIGASELLEYLWLENGLLDQVLETLKLSQPIVFSRRTGGAFYAFAEDAKDLDALQQLWTLSVQQVAPELRFMEARAEGSHAYEAFQNARKILEAARSQYQVSLPLTPPLSLVNTHTGKAVLFNPAKKDKQLDLASQSKRYFAGAGALLKKFDHELTVYDWPFNLAVEDQDDEGEEETAQEVEKSKPAKKDPRFPFKGDNRYVAVVHADGNRLGQLLRALAEHSKQHPESFINIFSAYSEAIEKATISAARQATAVLKPVYERRNIMPMRPIILGGDDITVIIRADLALEFTKVFLSAFAEESQKRLSAVAKEHPVQGLPTRLTACAGIAYIRSNQPLYLAQTLAEKLCKKAKSASKKIIENNDAKEVPASLALYRVTSTLSDDMDVLKELTIENNQEKFINTLSVYGLETDKLPDLQHLLALQKMMEQEEWSRGPARQLLGLLELDLAQAKTRYQRFRDLMKNNKDYKKLLDEFDKTLEALTTSFDKRHPELPFYGKENKDGKSEWHSPLGDAISLLSIDNKTF
jgi:hypothetical protein